MNHISQDRKLRLKLGVALRESRIRHLNKMGALASTAAIFEEINNDTKKELRDAISELNRFTANFNRNSEQHLSGWLLINLAAEVELCLLDITKQIIQAYPKKLGGIQVKLSDAVEKSTEEIVQMASDHYLNSLMYKKPGEYISGICEILSIDLKAVTLIWKPFIEIKARRDLGIHNDWKANEIYLRKLYESETETITNIGDDLCPVDAYVQSSYDACFKLVELIYNLTIEKHDLRE